MILTLGVNPSASHRQEKQSNAQRRFSLTSNDGNTGLIAQSLYIYCIATWKWKKIIFPFHMKIFLQLCGFSCGLSGCLLCTLPNKYTYIYLNTHN